MAGSKDTRTSERSAVANVLQANVMLSYPIAEAEELLASKLASAKLSFSNCEEDLDFLREQITVGHTRPLLTMWEC